VVTSKTVRDALSITHIFCYPKIPYAILVTVFSKGKIKDVGLQFLKAGLPWEEPAPMTDIPDSEAQFQRFGPRHIPENFVPEFGCAIQLTTDKCLHSI